MIIHLSKGTYMAVPKRKQSKARGRKRRTNWNCTIPQVGVCRLQEGAGCFWGGCNWLTLPWRYKSSLPPGRSSNPKQASRHEREDRRDLEESDHWRSNTVGKEPAGPFSIPLCTSDLWLPAPICSEARDSSLTGFSTQDWTSSADNRMTIELMKVIIIIWIKHDGWSVRDEKVDLDNTTETLQNLHQP